KLYMTLTNGHGAGCDSVFKGELASMRCNYSVARQHAYEAMYAAEESQDVTGSFGTALLLGRIAVTTSDMSALSDAIEYLETKATAFPFMIGSETNQVLLEIVRSMLLSMLDRAAEAPEWTIHRRSQHSRMALATIQLNYATSVSLMVAGEFENALGHLKAMTKQKYLLFNTVTQYFVYIGLSLCHLALMQPIQAKDALLKSICIAEEDRMITTFLHFRKHLTPILLMPEILLSHGPFVQAILKQKLTFARSDSDILPNLKQEDLPESLTSREEEIALLAARGLHNKEIADKLQISQWTVKNHLQSIYTKLDIDRRSQLTELLR
ncbi:MAG: LuxR C-terminal-related transcriptional regulator, partial [Clostridiaceae bacterium]